MSFVDTPLAELVEANAYTLVDEETDKVFGIGGIRTDGSNIVWLLCTKEVEREKIKFLRFMKNELTACLEFYPYLTNVSWEGNPLHIKWLNSLGAIWKFETDEKGFSQFWLKKETANV